MAVWSEIGKQNIGRYSTLSADYYMPEMIIAEEKVNCFKSKVPLKSICKPGKIITYGVLKPREVEKSEFKLARIHNSGSAFLFAKDLPFISGDQFEEYKRSLIEKGDIVVAVGGSIGPIAILSDANNYKININRHLARVSPSFEKIDPYYLLAYLSSSLSKTLLIREIRGAVQAGVNIADLKLHPVLVPNRKLQDEISIVIKKSEELLILSQSLYNQAQVLLERELGVDNSSLNCFSNIFGTSFNELMDSRRLDSEYYNPKVKSIVKKIRANENTKVKDNFLIKNGFPWHSKKFLNNNSGEPVVRIRDIKPTYIDNEELTSIDPSYCNTINFVKSQSGDITVGMDGLKYFYSSLIEEPCYINQRVCHLTPKSNSIISSEYLTFIINSNVGQSQLLRDMTIATTVGHITNQNIANLLIPIVSNEFHDNITNFVRRSIDAKKDSKILLEQAKRRVEELIEQAVEK